MHKIERYGWIPDIPDHRDFEYSAPRHVMLALPSKADLREQCPAVYDQKTLGSCTANAIGAAHQFDQLKLAPSKAFNPSRLMIYYAERQMEHTVNQDAGAQIRDGMKCVAQQGVCPETMWPYDITKFTVKPTVQCYKEAMLHQVTSYMRVLQTLDQMRGCLAAGYPFVFGFSVYASFETAQVAKDGIVPMPSKREQLLGGHAVMCLSGDTKIPCLDGTAPTLAELAETHGGASFWVYSCNDEGKVVPGLAYAPRKTGVGREVVAVELDNGEIVRCTNNHPFLMRNGEYKEAGRLVPGDSLMPLYRRVSEDAGMRGYEMVSHPGTCKWQFTHRMVAAESCGGHYRRGGVVHHDDFNKSNNHPDNLRVMSDDYLESRTQAAPSNHKVVSVKVVGVEDVYDLTVEGYHNFAVGQGVFVHNCVGYDDASQRFIVRNSWGTAWGRQGYFTMPYAYLTDSNLSADFWTIRMVEVA